MKDRRFLISTSNLLLALLLIAACSAPTSQTPVSPTPVVPTPTASPADEATILQIVRDAGKVEPEVKKNVKVDESREESPDGKTRYISEKRDVTDNLDNIMYLGMNDDIIWPGSLVRGDKVNDFVYEPIAIARGPVTLSLSLESSMGTGPSITEQVENPKLSTVRQGISNLLKKAVIETTRAPAKVEFNYQRIYEETQMKLVLGTDVKYGAGKVNANFNWDSIAKKTKILARYRQIYYSIDIDPPLSAADIFAPSMTAPRLTAALPPGSKPMYIAGVSYGMMALMFIETDESEENIKAALEAEYKGGADVKINGEVTAKNILESSSIKILVYGGSTAHLKNLETGYTGFQKVIGASSDFGPDTPGVPLLYKFRHLADNTLALTSVTSQYTITRPIQLIQYVKVTLSEIKCTRVNDDDGSPLDIDQIKIGLRAYNKTLARDGKTAEDELIDLQPSVDIPGSAGKVTRLYYVDTLERPFWHPPNDNLNTGSPSLYITFKTDPDIYDYALSSISLFGYAHDDDTWLFTEDDSDKSYGTKTIFFRDFLTSKGKHTLVINGTDFSLEVVVTIELVEQ